ncbi:hypothetical protein F5887DRAFT_1004031 [Amanita rubescens]|nr:hypothetical protein F5887DRAFT_1004031 [Amanita rubescens]
MNNGYSVAPIAVAGILTSIFGIIIFREQLGRSSSPLSFSVPIGEGNAVREKPHTTKIIRSALKKQVKETQQDIQTEGTPAPFNSEGVSYATRKKKRVTFVGDLVGPRERARQRDFLWLRGNIQNVDAHLRLRYATLDNGWGSRIMPVDDEDGDRIVDEESGVISGRAEQAWRREQPDERPDESVWFQEAMADEEDLGLLRRPLDICTCGNFLPVRMEEDGEAVRKITQTVEVTAEGLKTELRNVSDTQEISNKRIGAELESVELEIKRQTSLILTLRKSLDHASAEAQTKDQVTVDLERELAESKRQTAMYEHRLELMEALYSELEKRAGYDSGISPKGAEDAAMLGWEMEELPEKMRELERIHQQLYARDAVIWGLRQEVDLTNADQAPRETPSELETKIKDTPEGFGSRIGVFDKQSGSELEKLRMENVQLQGEITTLKHDRREIMEQERMVDALRSQADQWKKRFESAQEELASMVTELSESREETRQANEDIQALRLLFGNAKQDLRTENQTVVGLQDSVVHLESVIADLKRTCGDLRAERDRLDRDKQEHVEEIQDLKIQLTERREACVDFEDRMADLRKRDDELSAQLSTEKDHASMREADLQRALSAATSQSTEMKALQEELKKLRHSHDDLKGRMGVTTTHLESTQQALKERDEEVAELRGELLHHRESGREEEIQSLKNQLAEFHSMHEDTVSALGKDMEAMSLRLKKELEDLTGRNSQLDQWLSIQKEQVRIREQDWMNLQRIHKEEKNRSDLVIQRISQQLADQTQELRNGLNEMQESRDGVQERLENMQARLEDAQLALAQKDEEIASLHASLSNAEAGLQTRDAFIDNLGRDANSYKDDTESLDESIREGIRPSSAYSTAGGQREKQGRPLSEVLEDSGLFGKALSFGFQSSLKKKIPAFAREAVMKPGSGTTHTSSRASMRSV